MEKRAIFSQVPRPPKQIWEEDKPAENVVQREAPSEEFVERPSAITVVRPKKTEENKVEETAVENNDLAEIKIEVEGTQNELSENAAEPSPDEEILVEEKWDTPEIKDLEEIEQPAIVEGEVMENEAPQSDAVVELEREQNNQMPTLDTIDETESDFETPENIDLGEASNVEILIATPQKSSRAAEPAQGEIKVPNDEELYKRQYYTMGEVATMFNANQSQIRFWENEFRILQPKKNKKGDRYFRPEDVKNLKLIHHLLRNRKFTIEGANEYLKNNKQRAADILTAVESLQQLKSFLTELKTNL